MKWLQTRAEKNGLLTLPKTCLKVVSNCELQNGPLLPESCVTLLTDSKEAQRWELFNMETYSKNLKTRVLGRTVLYAEVVTSTMDLLEGYTFF